METSESSSPSRTRHLNFFLQVAFIGFIFTILGIYVTPNDPPSAPTGVEDLKSKANQADELYKAAIDERSKVSNKDPNSTEAKNADATVHMLAEQVRLTRDAVKGAVDAQSQYQRDNFRYQIYRTVRISLFPGVICSFFLVIYYGTSFEITPFRIFLPWLFKLRTSPPPTETHPRPELEEVTTPSEILLESVKNATKLAARMERRTNTHLILGVTMGLLGVSVWLWVQASSASDRFDLQRERETNSIQYRLERLIADIERSRSENRSDQDSDSARGKASALAEHDPRVRADQELTQSLEELTSSIRKFETEPIVHNESVGTILSRNLVQLLPKLTILIFIEVLAGYFLRQYRIGVEDLKYFLDLERKAKARSIAYSIYNQFDSAAKMAFAERILAETSQIVLKEGESTSTLKTIEAEKNEMIQTLEIIGKQLSSLVATVKKQEKV